MLGIIGAMTEEVLHLKEAMEDPHHCYHGFLPGKIKRIGRGRGTVWYR